MYIAVQELHFDDDIVLGSVGEPDEWYWHAPHEAFYTPGWERCTFTSDIGIWINMDCTAVMEDWVLNEDGSISSHPTMF